MFALVFVLAADSLFHRLVFQSVGSDVLVTLLSLAVLLVVFKAGWSASSRSRQRRRLP